MIETTIPLKNQLIEKIKVIDNFTCNRCLGTKIGYDSKNQPYCLECYTYGNMGGDKYLYRYERDTKNSLHRIDLNYELSEMQKLGSQFFLNCFENKKSGFLQAVCGAGKTEMTYEVILRALNSNLKICFILPRVQVLKQVYRRFCNHFPKTVVKPLYSEFKDIKLANIIISTPQQLIRFYREFDLVIVDEVDAFPFADNKFLERLLKKALKKEGIMLFMSATITNSLKRMIDSDHIKYFLIPERFHKQNLPVPVFIKCTNVSNNLTFYKFIDEHRKTGKKFLLFVSSINKAKGYYNFFRQKYSCNYLTSQSVNKTNIIKDFITGDYLFLITTTILERGVTFPNIDVMVLEADHKVFSKEALIQIAGRVGRNEKFSGGEIIFMSKYKSVAMLDARKEIIEMNKKKNEMQIV